MGHLTASQAQDLLPGRWSLAQRCSDKGTGGVTDAAVAQALDDGRLLRTHVLRPTWHVVRPDALGFLLAATAPRVHRASSSMNRQVGVDDELMRAVRPVLEARLVQSHATRAQVASALADAGIAADGVRLAHVLMYAELEGWICSGRRQGSLQTYALVAERLPDAGPVDREEALVRLASAYFASRGPATVRDLAAWASLTLTEARRAIAALGDEVEELDVAGRTFLVARGSAPPPRREGPTVHLVQTYDEIVSSYPESRETVGGGRVLERERTAYTHAVLLDGRLLGRWRYRRGGDGRPASVETRLVRDLTGDEHDGIDAEVRRFAT
ncbi:MAG: hypothetical protein QOK15_2905, partial [Nocardioidaceae bacterium]|nr:hypothetical protein [Nocardioidaceae bacterium]